VKEHLSPDDRDKIREHEREKKKDIKYVTTQRGIFLLKSY